MDTRDHRHGGPYDRGSADYYYGRPFNPHYFKGATYASEEIKITLLVLFGVLVRDNVVEVSLFCHEEGKLEGLPLNRRATEMAKGNLQPGDYLAGDVFLTGAPDENGDETDVPLPDCFKPA